MSPEDVRKYLNQVVNDMVIEVKFTKNIPIEHLEGQFAAMMVSDHLKPPLVTISLDNLKSEPDLDIKEHILHEAGHLHHNPSLNRNEGEYQAQVWALNKAQELGDLSLVEKVLQVFRFWRHCPDEYLYAYKKAVKNGILTPEVINNRYMEVL